MRLASTALFSLLLPTIAAAQGSGLFIQGGPLLDILATSNADSYPVDGFPLGSTPSVIPSGVSASLLLGWPSGGMPEVSQSRFVPGGSIAVGVFVSPSVSVRLEGSFQGAHVNTTKGNGGIFEFTNIRHATVTTDVIAAAGWHQGEASRASITYLAGIVFRRDRYDTTLRYAVPDVTRVGEIVFIGQPIAGITAVPVETTSSATHYGAGVMAGLDVTIKLAARFAIVPQLRMIAANHNWNLRPALTLRWRP